MPGWWFTVEAITTAHLLHQFRLAIEDALASKQKLRAVMRARSAKQRFPVAQWVEDLDILQSTSIRLHGQESPTRRRKKDQRRRAHSTNVAGGEDRIPSSGRERSSTGSAAEEDIPPVPTPSSPSAFRVRRKPVDMYLQTSSSSRRSSFFASSSSCHNLSDAPLSQTREEDDGVLESDTAGDECSGTETPAESQQPQRRASISTIRPSKSDQSINEDGPSSSGRSSTPSSSGRPVTPKYPSLPSDGMHRLPSLPSLPSYASSASLLDTDTVIGDTRDFQLQQVDPLFTDNQGVYQARFKKMLEKAGALGDHATCIEEYLLRSEKEWFQLFLNAKLGREASNNQSSPRKSLTLRSIYSPASGAQTPTAVASILPELELEKGPLQHASEKENETSVPSFLLADDYKTPRYLRNWMQLRIGDWPVYSLFLALGQIMAANSYQITLLTGQVGEEAERVYVLCGLYIAASILLWVQFRRVQSVIVLSTPFVFYGLAFITIGLARFGTTVGMRGWIQNIASGCYAIASASGSLYFSLNFGDEGGSTIRSWIIRACLIQGLQQIYVTALWFWGSTLSTQRSTGVSPTASSLINSWKVTVICVPIGVALWLVAAAVFCGLPTYYRQHPGQIPSFYKSVPRRKIILWFFATVIIQNFFLSAQYGRSWTFLWSSKHVPAWQIASLVAFFFLLVWCLLFWLFYLCSRKHSWLLPILAVGLGAPRWAQIWWGTSGMGSWLPWVGGSYTTSALVSRSIWLWLGTLDTVQSIGIGMILLSTMTRFHVNFTLIAAQVIGASVTAIARACAPNNTGPGPIFPNIVLDITTAWNAWFWIGLTLNAGVCIGFFLFYRKEQLTKP